MESGGKQVNFFVLGEIYKKYAVVILHRCL